MNLQNILGVPDVVFSTSRLGADVVLRKNPPGSQYQGKAAAGALIGRHKLSDHEPAFATHEFADMHNRRAFRRLVITRPLHAAKLVDLLETDARKGWSQPRDLVHDLGRMLVIHRIAERL